MNTAMAVPENTHLLALRQALDAVAEEARQLAERYQGSGSLGDAGGYLDLFERLDALRALAEPALAHERLEPTLGEEITAYLQEAENAARCESVASTARLRAKHRTRFLDALDCLHIVGRAVTPRTPAEAEPAVRPAAPYGPVRAGYLLDEDLVMPLLEALELVECLHELAGAAGGDAAPVITPVHLRAALKPLLAVLEQFDAKVDGDAYGTFARVSAA